MSASITPVVLYFIGLASFVAADHPMRWDLDVYTGRHFNTLVTSSIAGNDVIISATILVLYEPNCRAEAMEIKGSLRPWGPMDKYLTVAFHDYVTYPRHIWYELDEVDDLRKRYVSETDDCLKVKN